MASNIFYDNINRNLVITKKKSSDVLNWKPDVYYPVIHAVLKSILIPLFREFYIRFMNNWDKLRRRFLL